VVEAFLCSRSRLWRICQALTSQFPAKLFEGRRRSPARAELTKTSAKAISRHEIERGREIGICLAGESQR